ncbi:MAG: sigma-70 family RNA polymerase sigma factor [Chloroflexota bacterium]|jgi:RNA polymerase sigma-70 factor (ECF subfamily)|nr:sigma-70 family RNA polymerase sigma factor [Anaerolineae bacterium]HMM28032.1 sigma-70 family RNA polymerase sigma factor [Aggregatilineaceae bacterium]
MSRLDDGELVARLKAGDQAAYAQLVEEQAARIYRLALRMMGNEADAEDVLQETFLSAFRSIDSFEERSSLSTWLYRIATNAALMRLRRKEPEQVSVDEPLERDDGDLLPRQFFDFCCLPEDDLLRDEARAEMLRAIEELPATLRSVFVLRDIEGLSTEETANALDLSISAVKSRLMRARLKLRERLSTYFSQGPVIPETRQ